MNYIRLRAEYDSAFDRLRRAYSELWSIRRDGGPDRAAEEAARERFNQVLNEYHSCRDRLAGHLLSKHTVEISTPGGGTPEGSCKAARPGGREFSRQNEVRALAHRLWEEAGRPDGMPDEHWHRAEEILRDRPYRVA